MEPAAVSMEALFATTEKIAQDSLLFVANAHRFDSDAAVAQGIWNLRDAYKRRGCTLILLTTLSGCLPEELAQDVLMLDEPLPSCEELSRIVRETVEAAEMNAIDEADMQRAVDALIGLAAFPAEQVVAMSLSREGLDTEQLWERKRQTIEQSPGLKIWRGGETFADIGGCENVKTFLRAVLAGSEPPRVVVFLDEIEKAFAGTGTDLSGVKTEMTGTMLTWMQDTEADGLIFIGPPGAAKRPRRRQPGTLPESRQSRLTLAQCRVRSLAARVNGSERPSRWSRPSARVERCSSPHATRSLRFRPSCAGALRWGPSSSICRPPPKES